jgi:alpha-amylase/alpha-mannosidase (GH57 family)
VNVAFLLHLYQPPTQSEAVFRQISASSYLPLIKLLKNNPDYKLTLNVPLSLLEQMEKYGYTDWIKDLHDLYENERVEIIGSGAYHPLLTKIPTRMVYEEIILNEYGLGYYFGSKHGFEGEASILIKNLRGFFPPELALNEEVLSTINDLGYDWVVADKCAIPGIDASPFVQNIYKYKDLNTFIIIRDCEISNSLSFKRDSLVDDIYEKIKKKLTINENLVIALDGEAFGHHNPEGLYLLDSLIDNLIQASVGLATVSELLTEAVREKADVLQDSNWSETVCSTEPAKIYRLWDNKENEVQQDLWKIQERILSKYLSYPELKEMDGLENIKLWDKHPSSTGDIATNEHIELDILVNKSLHSDQFWWASRETLYDKMLFSRDLILKAVDLYKEIAARMGDKDLIKYIYDKSVDIDKSLAKESQ